MESSLPAATFAFGIALETSWDFKLSLSNLMVDVVFAETFIVSRALFAMDFACDTKSCKEVMPSSAVCSVEIACPMLSSNVDKSSARAFNDCAVKYEEGLSIAEFTL